MKIRIKKAVSYGGLFNVHFDKRKVLHIQLLVFYSKPIAGNSARKRPNLAYGTKILIKGRNRPDTGWVYVITLDGSGQTGWINQDAVHTRCLILMLNSTGLKGMKILVILCKNTNPMPVISKPVMMPEILPKQFISQTVPVNALASE